MHFLRKRGYKNLQPPFMMNKDQMAKTAQLDQFDEELYKVRSRAHYETRHTFSRPRSRSSQTMTKST